MDIRVRRLGAFNILFGVLSLLAGLLLSILFGGPMGMYHSVEGDIAGALVAGLFVFHLVIAIPCIVGGYHLQSLTEWSRVLLTFTSALNILNLPFGTVLGCYGLWVLLAPETEPLFAHSLQQRVSRKKSSPPSPSDLDNRATTRVAPSPRS